MTAPDERPGGPTALEHEAYGWVVRFVSGDAGPDDIAALQRWSARSPAHAAAFDRASKVWQATGPIAHRLAIAAGGRRPSSRPVHAGRRAVIGGAVSAVAAGAAFVIARPPMHLWPSWSEFTADYRTAAGQQRHIALPAGVSVHMNTRTSIALRSPADAPGGFEVVEGEAVIAATGAVTVAAAGGRIAAAGARFNLRCDGRSARVTCLSGELRVECGGAALPLPAGTQVAYADRRLGPAVTVDPAAVTAWQDGIVIFEATPISEVIEEVNRYRPGRIVLINTALGRERFSARFRIANIGGIVTQIEQVFGVRARILPGEIVLLG